jgi:hypothetical protein
MGIIKVSLKVIPSLDLSFVPYLLFHAQFVVVFIITQTKGKNKKLGPYLKIGWGVSFNFWILGGKLSTWGYLRVHFFLLGIVLSSISYNHPQEDVEKMTIILKWI